MQRRTAGSDEIESLLAPALKHPGETFIGFDFDGTLSPIVARPADARPYPGIIDTLDLIAARFGLVAVVTGRPASFLIDHVRTGPLVARCGSYGRQRLRGDSARLHPETERYLPAVRSAEEVLRRSWLPKLPSGCEIESKDCSFVLHYRNAPDANEEEIRETVHSFVAGVQLVAHVGRKSIEVVPPDGVDKGSTVTDLINSKAFHHGIFIGDDIGDMSAFVAFSELEKSGDFSGVRVVIDSSELDEKLEIVADLLVENAQSVLDVLQVVPPLV